MRLAAHAVKDYLDVPADVEQIYAELLSCRYWKWIDELETVAELVSWKALQKYCNEKEFELDMLRDPLWSCGDIAMIGKAAWKLVPGGCLEEIDE